MQSFASQTLPPGLNQPIQVAFHSCLEQLTQIVLIESDFGDNLKDSIAILTLNIIDVFSRYLYDMQTLLIELFDARNSKLLGIIPIQLKLFSTLDQFNKVRIDQINERFIIYDSKKVKIGETNVNLNIDYNIIKIQPIQKHISNQFDRISELSQPLTNKTQNQIVKLIGYQQYNNWDNQKQKIVKYQPEQMRIQQPINQYNQLPPLPPRRIRPQCIIPTHQKINITKTNIELYTLKLKNDQHLFKKQQQPTGLSLIDQDVEYIIQIVSVKLKSKPNKPLQKLTILYPQPGTGQHTTTIINPVKVENNNYIFGKQLVVKKGKGNQQHNILEVYFGQGYLQTNIDKLNHTEQEQVIILRKKDNTKHSQITIKVSTKINKNKQRIYIAFGKYTMYRPGQYFFKLNMKSYPESIFIYPTNLTSISFQTTFVSKNALEQGFLQTWIVDKGQQSIIGCCQLNLSVGSLYQKLVIQTIRKQMIGWIEMSWCFDDEKRIDKVILTLKQQIKQSDQKQNNMKTPIINSNNNDYTISEEQQNPRKIIQQPSNPSCISPSIQYKPTFIFDQAQLSHSDIYLKLLNNWHISRNPEYKSKSDKLSSQQNISLNQLKNWFNLLLQQSEVSKLITIFPEGFKFKYLINSYYIYCQYLIIYRNKLQSVLKQLSLIQSKNILHNLQQAIVYFGYIDVNTLTNIFIQSEVGHQLAHNILFFLSNDDQNMVLKKVLVQAVKNKKIEGLVPNGRILAYIIRQSGIETQQQWQQDKLSHIQYIVLKDNQIQTLPSLLQDNKLSEQALLSSHQLKSINNQQPHLIKIQQQQPIPFNKFIELTISYIESSIPDITDIIVNNKIYIDSKQIPKTIRVFDESELNIRIHSKQGVILQGSLIACSGIKNKSMKLFTKQKQMGEIFFGQQQNQIMINVNKTKNICQKQIIRDDILNQYPVKQPNFDLNNIPFKLQILDITPMSHYVIKFDWQSSQTLKFPEENATIITTQNNKLKLQINNNDNHSSCSINIVEGTQKYALSKPDGSIFCIVNLKIFANYVQPIHNNYKRRVFIMFKQLYRFYNSTDTPLVYFLLQYNNTFKRSNEFSLKGQCESVSYSSQIQQSEMYSLKLLNRNNKLLSKFEFQIKFDDVKGITKLDGTLSDGKYRLTLTLYQINIQKQLQIREEKVQNIMKLFSLTTCKDVFQKLSKGKQFKHILREDFGYTLTQINIIQDLISKQQPQSIFRLNKPKLQKQIIYNLKDILEQFSVFDFNQVGYVSEQKAKVVCDLLELKELVDLDQYIPSKNKRIIDYSNKYKNDVDYYSLLTTLFPYLNFINKSNSINQPNIHQQIKGLVKVQLIGFWDLTFRDKPPSLCFQINNKFITQPILRCSTFEFDIYPEVIIQFPAVIKLYNKQYGGQSLWSYKLITQCCISEIIEVLGGKIKFKISKLNQNQSRLFLQTYKPQRFNRNLKQQQQCNAKQEQKKPFYSQINQKQQQLQRQKQEQKQPDLNQEQLQEAHRINTILQSSIDISKYKFESSDQQS